MSKGVGGMSSMRNKNSKKTYRTVHMIPLILTSRIIFIFIQVEIHNLLQNKIVKIRR